MSNRIWLRRKFRRFIKLKANKTYLLSWVGLICLVLVAFGIYNFLLLPQVNLNGKKTLVMDYNDIYVEKGFKAKFLGYDRTDKVKIKGKVNTKKVGIYKITYKLKQGMFQKTITRKVVVKDRKRPVLDIDDSSIYLCPGDEVVPVKVKAFDEYDGDITEKVKITNKKDKIIYSVEDSSGNLSEVIKKVFYKDIEKPEVKLIGSKYMYVYIGEEYKEPGYEVIDNCSKNLKDNVVVTGSVDTKREGKYEITYSVTDNAGNIGVSKRTVLVNEKDKNGTIYLTFDDGPNSGTTDVILNILKEEGIKATFFVTNRGSDSLIKREYDEGHTIALHTASHDYSVVYSSVDSYFKDLNTVGERVKRITGHESKIIRFPGGSSNTISRRYSDGIMTKLTKEVVNRGYKYYDWNLVSGDADFGKHTAEEIRDNVIKRLSKDRVNMVLMHDIKPYTRDALRDIIKYGKENGYYFDKITMSTDMITQTVNN